MPSLIVLVGVPGSGKSTYTHRIQQQEHNRYVIVSRDDILMRHANFNNQTYSEAWSKVDHKEIDNTLSEEFGKALSSGRDIIVDMTNLTKGSRARIINRVSKDYTKYAVCFPITRELMMSRATARKLEGKDIPVLILEDMFKRYEQPDESEGFNTVIVIHG